MQNGTSKTVSVETVDGTHLVVRSWPQVIKWIDEVRDGWRWINGTRGSDPANIRHYIPQRLAAARDEMERFSNEARTLNELPGIFERHLLDGYCPPHPKSERGQDLRHIQEVGGSEAALFAFGLLQGLVNISHIQNNDHWRGAALALNPELLASAGSVDRFKTERASFIRAARELSEFVSSQEAERADQWGKAFADAGSAAGVWGRTLTRRWLRTALRARRRERQAMEKLHATDTAFTEKMALKAPVEYWEKKRDRHGKAEFWARLWVLFYFPIALASIGSAFWFTGQYLLTTPTTTLPPGIYIIASAGLASTAGLLFWAGRLLTKLYLSQHHLRQDADERATMTTTYLALSAEQAPAEGDRQIILAALFRSTPDGIVKEEGGLDPSIAAALGKFLAKP
ncbi:hypothetical protein EON83_30605 [bacterium]|nr:MAG: hypothetical protein EON83_30605 [bacterium]